jgi:DNA-binding NarL/FixJ family response regulator
MLRDLIARAGQGEGRVVLVSGEPGIGKTRLLGELAARARTVGWTDFAGRADEAEGMPPYLPWIEVLRALVRRYAPDELRRHLGDDAATVALLVPELVHQFPDLSVRATPVPEYERYTLFESVVRVLLAIARSPASPAGLLLVLDDLHQADAATVALLRHLARRLEDAPVLVVGAYRDADLRADHMLAGVLADLQRERLGQQLALTSLSTDDVALLIDAIAGPAAPAVVQAIHAETEGNPFFVEELLHHLQAAGYDLMDLRTAMAEWGLPQGVRHVVDHRLAGLHPETNHLLRIGAVLGDRWTLELLATVSELEFEPLVAALDEAVRTQLLREEGNGYRFTHALIRRALYDGLPLPFRQRFHLRTARAMEAVVTGDRTSHVTVLAAHYHRAGSAGLEPALQYAQEAARAARAVYAWDEEADQWQAAVDLQARLNRTDQAERCELLLALAEAHVRAGARDRGLAGFRQAAALARTHALARLLARALLGQVEELSRMGLNTGRAVDASEQPVALLEEALGAVSGNDSALHARVLARLAVELYMSGDVERSMRRGDAALAMARRLDDPLTLAAVLVTIHKTHWGPGGLSARLALTEELLALADVTGEPHIALSALNARRSDLIETGDLAAVDAAMTDYAQLVEDCRRPPAHLHAVAVQRAMRAILAGRLTDAEPLVYEARTVGLRVQCPDTVGCFQGQFALLRRLQGRLEDLDTEGQRALEAAPHPWMFCAGRSQFYSEVGNGTAARREFEHAAANDFAAVPRRVTWLRGLSHHVQLADVCAFLGDAPRAATLYAWLLPYAGQSVVAGTAVTCVGAVDRSLGLLAAVLGNRPAAVAHFEAALAMNARLGARPWLAHTQRQYAQLLASSRGRGDRRRARQLLSAAFTHYAELGMDAYAARTQALLAEPTLVKVPPAVPRLAGGLTVREAEVLALLAAGRSNRAIGEELVLSIRTVARHIANIYAKIGAHNRADAAAFALRHGLAPLTVGA